MADVVFINTNDVTFKNTDDVRWSNLGVEGERDIVYDTFGIIAKTRDIVYDSVLELSRTRDILYDLVLEISRERNIIYDSILELSRERNIVYDLVLEVSKERDILYSLQVLTFAYCLKIYDTSGTKVAEVTGDYKNVTLTEFEFEKLKQGGCGAFSFTLAKPFTQATIDYDYRVEFYIFSIQTLFYTGKIINKPVEGTDKQMTYSGWGYGNELEKKIINTEIQPGQNITTAVEGLLDTYITPYSGILKDVDLLEQVAGHTLVATIDVNDEEAKWIFDRLKEIAVNYKYGVNKDRTFYFQAIDTSIQHYWHIGKHLSEFVPEEDPSEIVKKVIAACDPQLFSDGYELKVTSEAGDYAGLYDKRFSVPQIINPFSETNIASGKSVSTNPAGSGAANITDDNNSTLWASGTNQASGHYIEIDLGADYENIAKVVIDSEHESAKEFVARSMKIEIRLAAGGYSTILQSDQGISWKPEITFRPTAGRYVRLSLTQSASKEWKVGEVEIYQLDLADIQRWADGQLAKYENVKKRATARIAGIDKYIMKQKSLTPIEPSGKARIFDKNGIKIDDYQMVGCRYHLSSDGFHLEEIELGEEKRTIADEMKDLERRIREAENTDVRRAKNLSLAKGFQLGGIKQTFIGEKSIQTPHLDVGSITAEHYYELRNTYVMGDQDSLDATYPFEMDFEIVSEMTAIVSVKLSFRIRQFRAYAKGVPSGGGHTTPSGGGATSGATGSASGGGSTSGATGSASGGGATSGGTGTPSGGGATSGSATHNHPGSVATGGVHRHTVRIYGYVAAWWHIGLGDASGKFHFTDFSKTSDQDVDTMFDSPAHSHDLNISADGAHSHTTPNHTHPDHTHTTPNHTHPNHTHTTPNHTHPNHQHSTPNHTHTVSNHTHSLTFGIYEDSTSPTVHYHIDNGAGYGGASSSYGSDQLDINITGSISGAGFKRIKFDSNARCRVSAWVLLKIDLTA